MRAEPAALRIGDRVRVLDREDHHLVEGVVERISALPFGVRIKPHGSNGVVLAEHVIEAEGLSFEVVASAHDRSHPGMYL